MGLYGISTFGTGIYGPDAITDPVGAGLDVSPFTVTALAYTSAQIRWSNARGAWSDLRLIRSTAGIPTDIWDGTLIYETPTTALYYVTDTGLTSGRWYYYALFLYDSVGQQWVRSGTGSVLMPSNKNYTTRLYDLIPAVFKSEDLASIGNADAQDDDSLYRFVTIFGYTLDQLRSLVESLLQLTSPQLMAEQMLPSAAETYGFDYEPELGAVAMRKLIRNAVHLYQTKGTLNAVTELASILSGWDAVGSVGPNLALDSQMAGFTGGIGLWGSTPVNVACRWRGNDGTRSAPYGDGYMVCRVVHASYILGSSIADLTTKPRTSAIPVTAGLKYTASIYLNSPVASTSGAITITWLDRNGVPIYTYVPTSSTALTTNIFTIVSATDTAPANAFFAVPSWTMVSGSGFTLNTEVFVGSFLFYNSETPTLGDFTLAWEAARTIYIDVQPDFVNYVTNPSGVGSGTGSVAQWISAGVSSFVAYQDPVLLTWSFKAVSNSGEGYFYSLDTVYVLPGETYTFYVDVRCDAGFHTGATWLPVMNYSHHGSYPFSGGYATADVSPSTTWQTLAVTYVVPGDGSVDTLQVNLNYYSGSGDTIYFRNATLVKGDQTNTFPFNGSTASPTEDFFWQGTAGSSRSSYYSRRAIKAARLLQVLPKFLPEPAVFSLRYSFAADPPYGPFARSDFSVGGSATATKV